MRVKCGDTKITACAIRYKLEQSAYSCDSPNAGIQGDTGWKLPVTGKGLTYGKMYSNRLVCMDDTRLTRSVFNWECSYKKSNWSADMKELL